MPTTPIGQLKIANYFTASTDALRNSFINLETSNAALRARVPAALLFLVIWASALTQKVSICSLICANKFSIVLNLVLVYTIIFITLTKI